MALSLSKGMLGVGCFFAFAFGTVHAAGFTEPPIVFYGKVTNTADGYALDLTQGQRTVLGHGIHLTQRERESSGPAATSLPTKVPRISPLPSASAVPWVAR